MWALYHAAWLVYDLAHLGRPWALFFVAMSVWGIFKAITLRRRWRE